MYIYMYIYIYIYTYAFFFFWCSSLLGKHITDSSKAGSCKQTSMLAEPGTRSTTARQKLLPQCLRPGVLFMHLPYLISRITGLFHRVQEFCFHIWFGITGLFQFPSPRRLCYPRHSPAEVTVVVPPLTLSTMRCTLTIIPEFKRHAVLCLTLKFTKVSSSAATIHTWPIQCVLWSKTLRLHGSHPMELHRRQMVALELEKATE